MAKDTKNNFDEDLFKKRVRLADSDQADGTVAYTQAVKQCRERTPPLLLYEAIVKYMSPPRPSMDQVEDENKRLEREVADLRTENARVRKDMADLITQRSHDEVQEDHDFGQLVDTVYDTPEGRIVAFLLLLIFRLLVYLKWEGEPNPVRFWLINAVFIPMGIFFTDWIRLQYRRSGMVVMLLRLAIVVAGLLTAYYQLFLVMPWNADMSLAHYPSSLVHSPEWAFVALGATSLVACSRLALFVRRFVTRIILPLKPFQLVRGMF